MLKRSVLNPVLIMAGGLTLVSGLLLLFHLKSHPVVGVHEISGLVFTLGCFLHIIVNWKPLIHSIKRRGLAWLLIVSLLSGSAYLTYSGLSADPEQGRRNHEDKASPPNNAAPLRGGQ